MRFVLSAMVIFCAGMAPAQDVVIIGEVHDNPAHHAYQAQKAADVQPKALVFEMVTSEQAARVTSDIRSSVDGLETALDWENSGWPDFDYYAPIFMAAPQARLYGALVPGPGRPDLMTDTLQAELDDVAARYALDAPLPADQQSAREALQMASHCNALPEEALPGMVQFQRLRDAALAAATHQALIETGGPVVVITGNGHARPDWGIPALLAEKAPEIDILAIGQTEDGAKLAGGFDIVNDAPVVDRPDPCLAFQ